MRFQVGPFTYSVRRVSGYIEFNGQRLLGLADHEQHELLISDRVNLTQQVQVLGHEIMEAWIYQHGAPRDKESACDLFGTALTAFTMDLMRVMGMEMLFDHRVTPEGHGEAKPREQPTASSSTRPRRRRP